MSTPSFSRSNINERTLYISQPGKSSFNLSHSVRLTPQMGRLHPVNYEYVIPSDIVSGGITPQLQLEKVVTPEIGRTRLDTHTFLVPYRRIINNFKQFVERRDSSIALDSVILPNFDYALQAKNILRFLLTSRINSSSWDKSSLYVRSHQVLIRYLTSGYLALDENDYSLLSSVLFFTSSYENEFSQRVSVPNFFLCMYIAFLADVYETYWLLLHDWYSASQFCYPSDFYAEQLSRVGERLERVLDIIDSSFSDPEPYISFVQNFDWHDMIENVIFVLQPYMGIGSNMDYLGYPIYREYSDWYNSFFTEGVAQGSFPLNKLLTDNDDLGFHISYEEGGSGVSVNLVVTTEDSFTLQYFPTIYSIFSFYRDLVVNTNFWTPLSLNLSLSRYRPSYDIFSWSDVLIMNPYQLERSGYIPAWSDFPSSVPIDRDSRYLAAAIDEFYRAQSELPLRAAYAAWFDRFRDWHIEPRTNTLDPDDWTLSPIFSPNFVESPLVEALYINFGVYVAMLVPRYRYYSKDALLTVQTEDVYRHVYSPIYQQLDTQGIVSASDIPSDEDVYNRILDIVIDEATIAFPSGALHRIVSNTTERGVLRNDLQTMRRTGMLESWLARNYFYPDNYNGQIEAHYGVQVPDLSLLYSTYLGGDESMISGDQVKAPVSTSEAPAGTRTFVGGAGHSDKFSFTFNDYGLVISFVSIVPLVEYDAYNSHLLDNTYESMPFPEYASDARITISTADILRGFAANTQLLGYVPRYYHYRVRLDEVHGRYLTDLRSYSWFRDWYNMVFVPIVGASATNLRGFSLHPYCLRVHLPLDSFLGLAPWSTIAFGSAQCDYYVTHPLPAAIESF